MRGFLFALALAAGLTTAAPFSYADDEDIYGERFEHLDSVVVSTTRAGKMTPVTYTMVSKEELVSSSPANSLPMVLNLQPSVVTTNEGGTGLGYSKMTVRGSKGSQINVTLNGITLNDSESQEVFWVNIPSLGNILSSVQLQRGLGTSANGAGAFGASVNMSTASVAAEPSASFEIGGGAFNTFTSNIALSTGLMDGFYVNLAYSKNTTDGYIRNAWGTVSSLLAVAGYMNEKNSVRLTTLIGNQHTGITWNGISAEMMAKDRRYNAAGEYYDDDNKLQYYGNESDNYNQAHVQLNYTHQFDIPLVWSTTANFTNGYGFYEQYKYNAKVGKYGYDSPLVVGEDSYKKTDFVIRKLMDNQYGVLKSDLRYNGANYVVTGGVYAALYDGDHFGDVIWAKPLGGQSKRWYENNGKKNEANAFARAEYAPLRGLNIYADLQYRLVTLDMEGVDDDFSNLTYSTKWNFFNPRAGVTYSWAEGHKSYASVALGHREPGRADIKEVIESNNEGSSIPELKPEKMLDLELGYEYASDRLSYSANLYCMEYKDMLLETGKISDSGYAIKENVPRSWRRGVEFALAYKPLESVLIEANATLSSNKILNYTAYYENYDNMNDWNFLGMYEEKYDKTTMLMSPSFIAMGKITWNVYKALNVALDGKFVGQQYWDNTASLDRSIPEYFVANFGIYNTFKLPRDGRLKLGLYINNLCNNMYYADAWVYRAHFEAEKSFYQEEGLFPQAPINAMVRMSVSF